MQRKNRKLNRYKSFDYSQGGYYFVTICVKDKLCYFGNIRDGETNLSNIGKIAEKYWLEIPKHFTDVELDKFIIMPNHVHGVVIIRSSVGNENFRSLQTSKWYGAKSRSLSSIIRGFKIGVTKYCNNNNIHFSWQKSFYDHVVRSEKSLNKIREYILFNPIKWCFDIENPKNELENKSIQKYYDKLYLSK